ncbi:MAG: DNA-protecting protein DprA [Planctomycetota bacterium]|nr:MAG: DNA-protecting protein DprA [Planctomycetota bacterium]
MTRDAALISLRLSLAFGPASALEPSVCTPLFDSGLADWELFELSAEELREFGVPKAQAARLRSPSTLRQAKEILASTEQQGICLLHRGGAAWPRRLDILPAAPRVLFAKGNTALLERENMIAVVGARSVTPYGREATRAFVEGLAMAGLGTYSGLARGVDAEAHRATMNYRQATVAVLGSGLTQIYPKENAGLGREIIARGGLLLSELPPGLRALRTSFPRRNRIIAGLAMGILVIEAARRSGALITAHWAALYDRPVWAVPGPYHAASSEGCHALIRDGAQLAEGPASLAQDLGLCIRPPGSQSIAQPTKHAGSILDLLSKGPRPTDVLATELELPLNKLLVELQMLQSAGWLDDSSGLWRRSR